MALDRLLSQRTVPLATSRSTRDLGEINPDPLHNALARGAWVLADCRAYLASLPTPSAFALCERIDDYFSETYSWLKSLPPSPMGDGPSSAPTVAEPGLGWRTPLSPTPPFPDSAPITETLSTSEEPSPTPSSGGRGVKKPGVNFF